ncbi:gp436 family protein [Desulfovibrio aminophilus]|uniref:gp436 family protein n=1 Tax=Desulfovibrio aminophilus TaxID=81425 RepID=UPI0004034EF2|nr:DUF1320 domain-containing protein [Desulfovibrio aminophilus]
MAYCLSADIRDQLDEAVLVQLTDDEDAGIVVESRVDKAIADADGEIDGYLGSRYGLPLGQVPPILRKIAVDIAIYNLFSRRMGAPEARAERYKAAVRFLEQVAKGSISLGLGDPDGTPKPAEAPRLSGDNPERLFSRDGMKDF